MMRPLGKPPTPSARSTASEPVLSVSTFILALLPSRMIEPSPNCFVMEESASSIFFSRTWVAAASAPLEEAAFLSLALVARSTGSGRAVAALDMADVGLRTFCVFEKRVSDSVEAARGEARADPTKFGDDVFKRTRQERSRHDTTGRISVFCE